MIITEIVHGRIIHFPTDETRRDEGAELVFNGRVRSTENGKLILALEYEHYSGMAEKELNGLAEETVEKFPLRDLFCRHRIGRINICLLYTSDAADE